MNAENVTAGAVKKWSVIAFLFSLPVAIAVSHFVDPGRGRAAGISPAVMILAMRAFWYLKQRAWFWMAKSARAMEAGCVFWGVAWEYCCSDARELVDENAPISLAFANTANPGRGAQASSQFRGKMHFAPLNDKKYLVHCVMFCTRVNRMRVWLTCSFP
jgi:hypothetical protein